MPIPEEIPIAYEPNYRTGHVGAWAGGQFIANVWRDAGHRRSAQWLVYLHEFDSQGAYLRSRTSDAGRGEDGRQAASKLLREWLDSLPGLAYGDIAIRPFRAEFDGILYGLIAEDGHGGDWAELYPDRLGFHAPWDGTYDT